MSALRRKYMSADPLLDDIAVGKRLSRSWPTHSAFLSTVDSEGIAGMLYPHINSHISHIFNLRNTILNYFCLKVIGTLYFTFTGLPFCLPGSHAGIDFTTRIASSSSTA